MPSSRYEFVCVRSKKILQSEFGEELVYLIESRGDAVRIARRFNAGTLRAGMSAEGTAEQFHNSNETLVRSCTSFRLPIRNEFVENSCIYRRSP